MLKSFQKRIAIEQHVVGIETGFFLSYSAKGPCFIGWSKTSGNGSWYQLQLQLTYAFPNEKPILTILSPKRLFKFNSIEVLNDIGPSHDFHINGTDGNGYLEICHTRNWDASKSCVGIILKGCLWGEAYDYYIATGVTIDDALKKIKEKQKRPSAFIKDILKKKLKEDFCGSGSVHHSNSDIYLNLLLGFPRYYDTGID